MYARASGCVYHRAAQNDDDGPSVAAIRSRKRILVNTG